MHAPLVKILSTKQIPETGVRQAGEHHIQIDSIPFIEVKHRTTSALVEKIEPYSQKNITAVFTSEHAVKAVFGVLTQKPPWSVFCISGKTKTSLLRHLDEQAIEGAAINGLELSQIIISRRPPRECVFFCGNKRMSTIPEALARHRIPLTELIVYDTCFSPEKIENHYDGILFFSPSAVESFFSINKMDKNTILFSVGKTTEKAIRKFTGNVIITSAFPGIDDMIRQVIDYKWKPTVKKH